MKPSHVASLPRSGRWWLPLVSNSGELTGSAPTRGAALWSAILDTSLVPTALAGSGMLFGEAEDRPSMKDEALLATVDPAQIPGPGRLTIRDGRPEWTDSSLVFAHAVTAEVPILVTCEGIGRTVPVGSEEAYLQPGDRALGPWALNPRSRNQIVMSFLSSFIDSTTSYVACSIPRK